MANELLLLGAGLAGAGVVAGGASLVQSKTTVFNTSATSFLITLDALPAAGNSLILLIVKQNGTSNAAAEGAGGGGAPFTLAINKNGTLARAGILYLHNHDGLDANVLYTTNSSTKAVLILTEWAGLLNAAPEATNSASALADANPAPGSVTPSSAHSLVVAVGGWTADNYLSGPTNSFVRQTPGAASNVALEGAYQIESVAAAYLTDWALTVGINWAASIAVFGAV